ncbi:MAG: hypothetical protein V4492_00045, partial [Chlamydiota bacterium]
YENNLERIQFCLDSLSPTDTAIPHLKELQETFQLAFDRWSQRKAAADQNPDLYVFFPSKDPLDLLDIRFLQEGLGLLGEGVSAIVVEDPTGLDTAHDFLKGRVFVPNGTATSSKSHATAVCGIIAQTAPKALQYVGERNAFFATHPLRDREIVNCSFSFCDAYAHLNALDQTWLGSYLLQGLYRIDGITSKLIPHSYAGKILSTGKLLIWALGNNSLLIDDSPALYQAYYSGKKAYSDKTIYVVNLQRDGLTPSPSTNFPGKELAKNTVCSIGQYVNTTDKGNTWTKASGT